jgi:transposase
LQLHLREKAEIIISMPKPYSNDLRARVIQFYENHEDYTQPELAEEFGVSLSTLEKWLLRWRTTGSSNALPPAGGRASSLQKHETALQQLVAQQPDATLDELQHKLQRRRRITVHPSTLSRALERLGLRRKKRPTFPANNSDRT